MDQGINNMEGKSKGHPPKVPLAAIQTVMRISKACNPAALSHIPVLHDYEHIGALADIGQQAMERYEESRQVISIMESIQSSAQIGELSELEHRVVDYQEQMGTMFGSFGTVEQSALGVEAIVRGFDAAIGATCPGQLALNGFQSSWPAIEAFNSQLEMLENQGVPYSRILENLRASDFFQRNHDLLVTPAIQIYETCSHLPDMGAQILEAISPIESIITNLNASRFFNELSPLLETILSIRPDELFWKSHQRKCLRALKDAKWSPSLLFDLPEQEIIPLNKILMKKMSHEERIAAIDRFVFKRFGRDYIAGILEDWEIIPNPAHIRRLMCEAVKAYRRKEYGLVIHALPMQWEYIIKQKAGLPERVKSNVLKAATEKLISENDYPKILNAFYEEYIMYQCNRTEDYIPDVPGRNAIAHGWFVEYPSRKAALNAILFTDFLLHLDELERICAAS